MKTTAARAPGRKPSGIEDATRIASEAAKPVDSGSSLKRMLRLLDLFTLERPVWSTTELVEAAGVSRSTGYRYIECLSFAGLIAAVGNGSLILGPRIVELDFQIRSCDPLHRAGKGVLEQLMAATGHSALLCMLSRYAVLCIHEVLAPFSPENLFGRGQRRPLMRGAASKIILPYLPVHQLRNIFNRSGVEIAAVGLGEDWAGFRSALASLRKDGYALTSGEFNPGVYGLAAPVFNAERLILGSVGVAWGEEDNGHVDIDRTVLAVKRAAREITHRLATSPLGSGLPPRAVS